MPAHRTARVAVWSFYWESGQSCIQSYRVTINTAVCIPEDIEKSIVVMQVLPKLYRAFPERTNVFPSKSTPAFLSKQTSAALRASKRQRIAQCHSSSPTESVEAKQVLPGTNQVGLWITRIPPVLQADCTYRLLNDCISTNTILVSQSWRIIPAWLAW